MKQRSAMQSSFRQPSILPGFGLTLGFSTFFLSAIVLLPLAALITKTASMGWGDFFAVAHRSTRGRVVSLVVRRSDARGAHQQRLRLRDRLDARTV